MGAEVAKIHFWAITPPYVLNFTYVGSSETGVLLIGPSFS